MKNNSNKPTVELMTVCDFASVDREGKLNIMGMFREMVVDRLPAYLPHFYLASTLVGDKRSAYDITIVIENRDGSSVVPKQEVAVQIGPSGFTNLVTDIFNLPLDTAGMYTIKLIANDGSQLASCGFRVFNLNKQTTTN